MHPVPFIRKESKTNLRLWIIFVAEYQGMFLVISDNNVKWYSMVKCLVAMKLYLSNTDGNVQDVTLLLL